MTRVAKRFRGKVRLPNAALVSRSVRERKVGIYLSEELIGLVLARAVGREWSGSGGVPNGRYQFHLHDAIRLALYEWATDSRTVGVTKVGGLASLRPIEPFTRGMTAPEKVGANARRDFRRAVQGADTFTGGLFYPFREE